MKRILTLVMALGLLLTACGPTGPVSPTGRAEFDAFVSDLNGQKKSVPPWTQEETEAYRLPTLKPGLVSTAELDALLAEPETPPEEITIEEARADADLFFRLLKSSYGAYEYFGGDKVFLGLRDRVMSTLDHALEPTIPAIELYRYFNRAFTPVIQDGHFTLNGYPFAIPQPMYYVADLYLTPEDTDPETAQLLRPTIDPDGALSWCFATTHQSRKGLPTQAVVRGEGVALHWQRALNYDAPTHPGYEEEGSTLPALISRSLEPNAKGLDRLAKSGDRWRGRPLFLVDLRGNGGGDSDSFHQWFKSYAGAEPEPKRCRLTRYSLLYQRTYVGGSETSLAALRSADGTSRLEVTDSVLRGNRNLIFLLQDGTTAGSAEEAVAALRTLENVITVGSGTIGCAMMGGTVSGRLPHSGVTFTFGTDLTFYGSNENTEGRGILPDLWVPPQQAEDAVARLVRYYGLK